MNSPAVTDAAGHNYPGAGPFEIGGAVINLKYTPVNGAPVLNTLEWIQAYTGTIYGNAFGPILDNDPAHPYSAQDNSAPTPFYGPNGPYAGGANFFVDRPQVPENEYENNPIVHSEFQVVLASWNQANNKVTLYGGVWWGFEYSAVDTPEPSTLLLASIGGSFLMLGYRRRAIATRSRPAHASRTLAS